MAEIKGSTKKASPTQDFVPVKEVRDGIVVLKDESLRGVFMASSLNLSLKSQDEQASILFQFQNFLNSLDFSIQLSVQSRELDIRPYLTLLEERYAAQTSELMRIQVREYIQFVRGFTEQASIMTKSFFIIVPYTPPIISPVKDGFGLFGSSQDKKEKAAATFEENRSQLEQRMAAVENGISRTGVRVVRLGTEQVIELFYKIFNLGELERPIPFQK